MQEKIIRAALFDFFEGNHTAIQKNLIEDWLKDSKNENLYYEILDEWEKQHPQYDFEIEQNWNKLKLDQVPLVSDTIVNLRKKKTTFAIPLGLAAGVLLLLVSIYMLNSSVKQENYYEKLVLNTKINTGDIYEKINITNEPMLINLPDNSSVILHTNSRLSYSPSDFKKNKREVLLSGEAFFEVQKNVKSPFYVVTNNLITKVLGTSFSVKSYQGTKAATVVVKTGKVAVFKQNGNIANLNNLDLSSGGLLLSANQQVVFTETIKNVISPQKVQVSDLSLPIQKLSFEFDETPLIEVFEKLESAYQIKIIFDKTKIAKCKLTAYLSDEPLHEKIRLICFAIDAKYQIENNQIIIDSKACH